MSRTRECRFLGFFFREEKRTDVHSHLAPFMTKLFPLLFFITRVHYLFKASDIKKRMCVIMIDIFPPRKCTPKLFKRLNLNKYLLFKFNSSGNNFIVYTVKRKRLSIM